MEQGAFRIEAAFRGQFPTGSFVPDQDAPGQGAARNSTESLTTGLLKLAINETVERGRDGIVCRAMGEQWRLLRLRGRVQDTEMTGIVSRYVLQGFGVVAVCGRSGRGTIKARTIVDNAEQRLDGLNQEGKALDVRSANFLQTAVLTKQRNLPGAIEAFRSAYAAFLVDDEIMIGCMPRFASDLIAAGALAEDLLEILYAAVAKADTLAPLVVALRQHAGETVRAPSDILEVASGIRESFSPDST